MIHPCTGHYCADNPFAAQAAAASLLAGAAWIEAVQSLAAVTKASRVAAAKKSSGRHDMPQLGG